MHALRKTGWMWAALPPFAITLIGFWVFSKFLDTNLEVALPQWKPASIVGAEAIARFWVATSLLLFLVAAGAAFVMAVAIMCRRLDGKGPLIGGAVALVLLLLTAAFASAVDECRPLYNCLGKGLFKATLGGYPALAPGLPMLDWIIEVGTIAGMLAAVFVTVAVAALAPDAPPDLTGKTALESQKAMDAAARKLADRVRDLKYLLFAASAVLFAGALHMKAWRDWPLAFFDPPSRRAYSEVATATVNYQAFHFVLILAAIFLPMALRLRHAGSALAERDPAMADDPAARRRWIDAHGITLSLGEQAQRAFALITPFLAAPALQSLKTISDHWIAGG